MADATKELKVIINLEDNLSRKMPSVTGSIIKAELAMTALRGAMNTARNVMNTFVNTAKEVIMQGGKFESWRLSFDTMLGSAEKGSKLMKEVSDFARKTPFDLPQVVEGSKQLLAMGSSADEASAGREAFIRWSPAELKAFEDYKLKW